MIQPGIDALATVLKTVRQTHGEIAVRPDAASDPYMVEDEIGNIRGAYNEALYAFLALRRQLNQAEAPTPTAESSNPPGSELDSSCAELPKMSLPEYSGDEEYWGTSTANDSSSVEALQTRYYNPRLLLFKKLQALLDLPRLRRESIAELRSLLDKIQCIVRSLKNAGWPVESWDSVLFFLLVTRLDTNTSNAWNAEFISRECMSRASGLDSGMRGAPGPCFMPTFADLVEFLESRARNCMLQVDK
ncbi:hypothetical protein M0804_015354 [Polistes exclamans]|nr:hypothetical protein M0804_015354 [Polistes exclamans]